MILYCQVPSYNCILIIKKYVIMEKQQFIQKAQINACLRGHTKTSNGYKWNLCSVEDL